MTMREAARRAGRDRNADGKIEFPFDAVHVDFMLEVA